MNEYNVLGLEQFGGEMIVQSILKEYYSGILTFYVVYFRDKGLLL